MYVNYDDSDYDEFIDNLHNPDDKEKDNTVSFIIYSEENDCYLSFNKDGDYLDMISKFQSLPYPVITFEEFKEQFHKYPEY